MSYGRSAGFSKFVATDPKSLTHQGRGNKERKVNGDEENLLLTQILNPPHPYQSRTRERADDARAEPDRHRLCEVSVCVVEFERGRFVDVEDAHCRFVEFALVGE